MCEGRGEILTELEKVVNADESRSVCGQDCAFAVRAEVGAGRGGWTYVQVPWVRCMYVAETARSSSPLRSFLVKFTGTGCLQVTNESKKAG